MWGFRFKSGRSHQMINKVGKKTKAWVKAKRELVKGLKDNPEFIVVGLMVFGKCKYCKCGRLHKLTPHHKIHQSQGGGHDKENIDWICMDLPCCCHQKEHGMKTKDDKPKDRNSKKANWQKEHQCKNCKAVGFSLLCTHCNKLSV